METRPMPESAYYKERDRYRADTLLNYLKRNHDTLSDIILALTTHDISTSKGNIKDYGIMGLGFNPGNVCIVSSYRLSKDTKSQKQISNRFIKVVLHELGHNFGLTHCTYSKTCYMQDAEGSIKTIDRSEKYLCENCRKHLILNEQ
ncbi:MAG: hypothetical protein JST26_03455 [Bacteroidetes bacterium]|nr:hypothetical protein [Bacteroidota bacterium]